MLHMEFYIEGKGTTAYAISLGPNEVRKNTRSCSWSTAGHKTVRAKVRLNSGPPFLAAVEGVVVVYVLSEHFEPECPVKCSAGSCKQESDLQ
jgi:hypothetical protein